MKGWGAGGWGVVDAVANMKLSSACAASAKLRHGKVVLEKREAQGSQMLI